MSGLLELQQSLVRLDTRIEQAKLFAQWHMLSTVNGLAERRSVWRGDAKLTREELIADSMDTARRHMQNMEELAETKCQVLAEIASLEGNSHA